MLGDMPTNSYIIYNENTGSAAIFDPAADCPKILRILTKNSLSLKYIFLTHGHADHIGALNELRESTGAKLVMPLDDILLLQNCYNNCSYPIFGESYTVDFPPDIILNDGDIFMFEDIAIACMLTPGHTIGSCVYLIDDIMISGDTVFKGGIGRTDLYSGSYPMMKASLNRLYAVKFNYTVLPGHGYATTLNEEKQYSI